MAQLTFSDLKTQVRDHVANCESGRITRAANMALRRLYQAVGPTVRFTVTTVAPYDTGTVAITKGDTAVTLTGGTFAASTDGQLFRGQGEATWYGFTRGGATSGTLGSAFSGTTLTTGTFDIAYGYADLPTTISATFDLWRDERDRLHRVTDDEVTRYREAATDPGIPLAYAVVKGVTAGSSAVRVLFLPFPDAIYTFTASGRARPTLMADSGTEYSGLPEDYDEPWLAGTLFYLWDGEDKQDRSGWWRDIWRETLNNAQATQNEGIDTRYGDAYVSGPRLWQRYNE